MTLLEQELKNKITSLHDPHELELLGKNLNSTEFFALFSILKQDHKVIEKLNAILAGISHDVFFEVLPKLSAMEIQLLQQESATIPVQHHLTALSLEKTKVLKEIETTYASLETFIEHIEVDKLRVIDCTELLNKIRDLQSLAESQLDLLNQGLKLAWNSDRADLIENLSFLKETILKYKLQFIRELSEELKNKFNSVYADFNDDKIPVMEALTKLSVWHLKDYFDLGLLPEDAKPLLDKVQDRQRLISQIKKNLEKINLVTLEDLKTAHIYSKKALQEFLKT